ncbi:hypothetical protein [Streptomyces sp. NPDC057702]|uniref:hypothetical protein n=1 Tax=unclassified Streptomyces TaxID=2593676 RepID=UPI00369FED5E
MVIGLGVSGACAVGALIAAVGVIAMAVPGRPEPWAVHLARRAATLCAAAAASLYCLGFFAVLESDLQVDDGAAATPAPACRDGFDTATTEGLTHHRTAYLPLRFDCVRADGSVYSSDPSYAWLNGGTLALALCAAVLALTARHLTRTRARRAASA